MTRFILKRIILIAIVLLLVNALSYMLFTFLNLRGPMALGYLPPDEDVPLEEIIAPYPEYINGLLHGDLGEAGGYFYRRGGNVIDEIKGGLPRSLILLAVAVTASIAIGLTIGFLSVNYKTRQTNPIALVLSLGGFSMPGFYLGIVVLYLMFTSALNQGNSEAFILPVSGYGLDKHLILPALALAARPTAEIARLTAELLVEELPKNYVRTARAKGLPWRLVIVRHAFRNVAGAVITAFSNSLSYLIGALVIVERVFDWGGLGQALIDSVSFNHFAGSIFAPEMVAGMATAVALLYLLADLVTELAAQTIDPRLRRAFGEK